MTIQLASLTISAVTLVYLIKYVSATDIIARQSVQQVEATFRPAIVAITDPRDGLDGVPKLVNIGKGPAMEIEWFLSSLQNIKGTISYLETTRPEPYDLRAFSNMKPFFHPSERLPAIVCTYKSISGARYSSTSTYDINTGVFSTTFHA